MIGTIDVCYNEIGRICFLKYKHKFRCVRRAAFYTKLGLIFEQKHAQIQLNSYVAIRAVLSSGFG